MKHVKMVLPMILFAALAVACGEDDEDGGVATLTADVMPIVSTRCGSCHQPGGNANAIANGVFFNAKADILGKVDNAFDTIISGDSANSGLIKIMRQEMTVGMGPTEMPPAAAGADPVPASEIDTVAEWIDAGALDN